MRQASWLLDIQIAAHWRSPPGSMSPTENRRDFEPLSGRSSTLFPSSPPMAVVDGPRSSAQPGRRVAGVGTRRRAGRGQPVWEHAPTVISVPEPTAPIGVFDSGVGGLTVLHELLVALPQEDFLYVGDSARFPYGDRTAPELRAFSRQIADILLERGVKLIVIACNSATSSAIDDLPRYVARRGHAVDVIGVVGPESNLAVAQTDNGKIGVLATPATIASGAYERAVLAADPLVRLTSVPCPELAQICQTGAPITERTSSSRARTARRCAPPASTP